MQADLHYLENNVSGDFMFKKIIFITILFLISLSCVNAEDGDTIKLSVNNHDFDVKLENNSATNELVKKLHEGNITIEAKEYGGFEKVGDLGFSLPANDEQMSTSPGDIVLYQSNQISLFYGGHSWSYTKIGKIQSDNLNDLKSILGSGNVNMVLSLK